MGRRAFPSAALVITAMLYLLAVPVPAQAELRISNFSVFLNDFDVLRHGALEPLSIGA